MHPHPHPHPKAQDNGTQKRTHHQPAQPLYRECLKNHAATLGGHATDGCGEFIASPASTPSDPSSLTCAACGCHRNFHRRVAAEDDGGHSHEQDDGDDEEDEAGSHVLLTLKTGGGGGGPTAEPISGGSMKRKRFRSKFSREQKEGMMELAERLGWRLQRRDEDVVDEGCRRIGVERGVFKVWMHNNKQVVLEMKRRDHHHHHHHGNNNNNNNGNKEENKVNGVNNCSSSSPSDDPN